MSCINMASAFMSGEPSTSQACSSQASTSQASTSRASTSTSTSALSLLQCLQKAIFSGQPQVAADFASKLAEMRANCSMSMKRTGVHVVNEVVTEEPIRVQVGPSTTISDLETQIYQKHKVPIQGRRMVLLDTLPQENPVEIVGAENTVTGSVAADLENSTNILGTASGSATKTETAGVEWICAACTFINEPNDTSCSICDTKKDTKRFKSCDPGPSTSFAIPEVITLHGSSSEDEFPVEQVYSSYQELLDMEKTDLITNLDAFECPICMSVYHPGDGVVLKTCLHSFCRDCLKRLIETSTAAEIKCPYVENYACNNFLQDREIRALVTPEAYKRYLQLSVNEAESKMANTFHCKTTDCTGWCEFEVNVNLFGCPVCYHNNCLSCQAIHEGLNCAQYQRKIQIESENNPEARETLKQLEKMLEKGEAMNCPKCQIIILKRSGCDAILCTMCKTEICWATKGPRWGPRGHGDRTGGCGGCVGLRKCHPKCHGCH